MAGVRVTCAAGGEVELTAGARHTCPPVAARLAGDCARARPHLAALAAAGALGEDAPAWSACGGRPDVTPP